VLEKDGAITVQPYRKASDDEGIVETTDSQRMKANVRSDVLGEAIKNAFRATL
jgi:hypothetical protein